MIGLVYKDLYACAKKRGQLSVCGGDLRAADRAGGWDGTILSTVLAVLIKDAALQLFFL